jgi:Zn2+/Cd2+-exporting ATPase
MQKNNVSPETDFCPHCAIEGPVEEEDPAWIKTSLTVMVSSALILALGLYLDNFTGQTIIAEILFLTVAAISGYEIIKKGILTLLRGKFSINLLITIAALGAFLIGHGEEGASVIFLFFIAEFLEEYAALRSRKEIGSLLKLAPETATLKEKDKNLEVHAHAVNVDDIIVVKPGDKIPLDGVVVEGTSTVNQANITGESIPVLKTLNSEVFAGTVNQEGYLEIKVTKKSDETVISKIIELVKQSQKRKSKTEAFIEKFASYYTPVVILLAALVAVIPPLIFGLSGEDWFYRALVLLVVSCPCALAISTPVSMVSAITSATRNGVLIKGSEYIEEMGKIRLMVFDKTGTLTKGELEVTDIISVSKYSSAEILEIAASLESRSKHPLAEPMVNRAIKEMIPLKKVKEFRSITGRGITGKINDKIFYVGKISLYGDYPVGGDYPVKIMERLEGEAKTTVLVGNQDQIIGVIGLRDQIRDSSLDTIELLKGMDIQTAMLTGDNQGTAKAVSSSVGIEQYYAELLPEDKVKIIGELSKQQGHVAMVGDGVNDAPALARANIGIAMGAAGSDVAIETADIALMNDDLLKVDYLMELSRKTMSIVRQNVSVSILIKSSFAVMAVLGLVTLWMAVAIGDMGLSLAVILNALRIGRKELR